jgi:Immunity protein Imm1
MQHRSYFHNVRRAEWPSLEELAPYFLAEPEGSGWFHESGNDTAGLSLHGLEGTEHLPYGNGQIFIELAMWGNPDLGVLLIYTKAGGPNRQDFTSIGDLTKLKQWVRALHDTPLPVGLFIPFPKAWLAVKEFMETNGQLPTSIEWIKNTDLPANTFPDPTVQLPSDPD